MDLMLSLNAVSKNYDGKIALRNCSVTFDHGVYAFMGPNGSGKSTLLSVCALLEPVDAGLITYSTDDGVLSHDISLRRRITLVLPKVGIFHTSVFKNAAYGLNLRGMPKPLLEQKTATALEAVGLLHKKQQNALTLSSGEAQRLGLARAMAIEPDILFLDEPTASIDEENTRIVEDIILTMKQTGKTMVIMSTHDREQAARLADTVIMMREGRIL